MRLLPLACLSVVVTALPAAALEPGDILAGSFNPPFSNPIGGGELTRVDPLSGDRSIFSLADQTSVACESPGPAGALAIPRGRPPRVRARPHLRAPRRVTNELVSPRAFGEGYLRPLAALDLKWDQETGWEANLSVRAGTQIESPVLRSLKIQLLGGYYRGRSPNGQFFDRDIEYAGFGAHLHF